MRQVGDAEVVCRGWTEEEGRRDASGGGKGGACKGSGGEGGGGEGGGAGGGAGGSAGGGAGGEGKKDAARQRISESFESVSDCDELADALTHLCEDVLTTAVLVELALAGSLGPVLEPLLWLLGCCCCCYCCICRSSFRRPVRDLDSAEPSPTYEPVQQWSADPRAHAQKRPVPQHQKPPPPAFWTAIDSFSDVAKEPVVAPAPVTFKQRRQLMSDMI